MRLTTLSQIDPFSERQTRTQRQNGLPMPSRHLSGETVHCPIKHISSQTFEKAIAITGGCYE
jgi:hypothetical protein